MRTKDAKTHFEEKLCSGGVGCYLCVGAMGGAIKFENQLAFPTGEIREVRANRQLADELEAAELTIANCLPNAIFRRCFVGAQNTRSIGQPRLRASHEVVPVVGISLGAAPHPSPLPVRAEGREREEGITLYHLTSTAPQVKPPPMASMRTSLPSPSLWSSKA